MYLSHLLWLMRRFISTSGTTLFLHFLRSSNRVYLYFTLVLGYRLKLVQHPFIVHAIFWRCTPTQGTRVLWAPIQPLTLFFLCVSFLFCQNHDDIILFLVYFFTCLGLMRSKVDSEKKKTVNGGAGAHRKRVPNFGVYLEIAPWTFGHLCRKRV